MCYVDIFIGGGGDGRVMLTLSMVVVWESREQPVAALNHRCTEH